MKLKKLFSAFTLTELLIALAILGALAGMAIPSLMEGLQKKQLTLQLKNTIAGIQQIAHNQMIAKNTKDLTLTDFTLHFSCCFTNLLHSHFVPLLNNFTMQEKCY